MKLSKTTTRVILAVIILLSLGVSTLFLFTKQGYHEDELLTYNLANSSKQLNIGGWNTPEDMNEYLAVYPEHRFDRVASAVLLRARAHGLLLLPRGVQQVARVRDQPRDDDGRAADALPNR